MSVVVEEAGLAEAVISDLDLKLEETGNRINQDFLDSCSTGI